MRLAKTGYLELLLDIRMQGQMRGCEPSSDVRTRVGSFGQESDRMMLKTSESLIHCLGDGYDEVACVCLD